MQSIWCVANRTADEPPATGIIEASRGMSMVMQGTIRASGDAAMSATSDATNGLQGAKRRSTPRRWWWLPASMDVCLCKLTLNAVMGEDDKGCCVWELQENGRRSEGHTLPYRTAVEAVDVFATTVGGHLAKALLNRQLIHAG